MSAIAADLPFRRPWRVPKSIGWLIGTIMAMGWLVIRSSGGGGGDEALSWSAVSGATGYKVYWNDTDISGPPYENSSDVGNVTEASPVGFDAGEPAAVRAYDESGLESAYSTEINTPSCTTTIGPGTAASVATALGSASAGDVICLNTGDYTGACSFNSNKAGRVIIRSASGTGANFTSGCSLGSSNNVTLKNIKFPQGIGFTSATNITLDGNVFQGANAKIDLATFTSGDRHWLLINNTIGGFDNDADMGSDGQLYIRGTGITSTSPDIVVAHNTFDGTGACADGIQLDLKGSANGITIGPGNIFRDWVQGSCGTHVDAIQLIEDTENVTIEGNYFENNQVHFGFYDGSVNVEACHNIFNGSALGHSYQSFQIGGIVGMNFCHNTLKGPIDGGIGSKAANDPNSGWIIENNIFLDVDWSTGSSDQDDGCGSGCLFRYNIIDSASSFSIVASPTNTVTTAPTFSGGSSPATWAGWALANGSAGESNGNDGNDRGSLYFNPAAPANLQEN